MRKPFLIALVCLCGCAVQPATKRQPLIQSRQIQSSVAQGGASVPASRLVSSLAPPEIDAVTLRWTVSEPSACIVYASKDKKWWSPLTRVETDWATVPVVPPMYFYVTAISSDGESLPSNTLGILGKAPVGLRVIGEHAASPDGPWVAYDAPIYDGPADQSMAVFRLKAVNTGGWQTVSEP